jgi:ammonium transporter, Amt family
MKEVVKGRSAAISVHLLSGLWGLAAAGIFAPQHGQFLAQLVGIATLLCVFLPTLSFAFLALNRLVPFRVDADGERIGMEPLELGGGAYPEFVIDRDDPIANARVNASARLYFAPIRRIRAVNALPST